ncbi:hypothetical protein CRENBAI_007968 [Crenichthys baileyi]|uniref:Uncharacterized protein n=1 Tax=Crenichthys baileyi TaxID=28760 RepID=A0AAV9SEH9_9TELE
MHAPQTIEPRPPGAARQSSRPRDAPPPPPPCPRGTVKTTNPKNTPPTRNHPADKQTPPQHKAERPDATAKLSDARPTKQNVEGKATTHRTTNPTPQHAKQRRTECSNEHPK